MRPQLSLVFAAVAAILATAVPAFADAVATVLQTSMMHDGPAAHFPRLGVVERNQRATMKGCNKSGRWCEIEAGSKRGWIMGSHLGLTESASAPAEKPSVSPMNAPPPAIVVETEKTGKGDKLLAPVPGRPVTIIIKSADGKVSSTMTVAAGSNVVVTASGRSHCELKAAVNP